MPASSSSPSTSSIAEAPDKLTALLGGPADLVLSDMAANATGHKKTDHLRIIGLAETAAEFAREILAPGGAFLAKVLQGGTENALLADLKRDFATVRHVKPAASRADSGELYVLATGYRAHGRPDTPSGRRGLSQSAMPFERALALVSPTPLRLRRLGYVRQSDLLHAWSRRRRRAWAPHLSGRADIVTAAAESTLRRRHALVLGSGFRDDVPSMPLPASSAGSVWWMRCIPGRHGSRPGAA